MTAKHIKRVIHHHSISKNSKAHNKPCYAEIGQPVCLDSSRLESKPLSMMHRQPGNLRQFHGLIPESALENAPRPILIFHDQHLYGFNFSWIKLNLQNMLVKSSTQMLTLFFYKTATNDITAIQSHRAKLEVLCDTISFVNKPYGRES